jgi:hypothetical protein
MGTRTVDRPRRVSHHRRWTGSQGLLAHPPQPASKYRWPPSYVVGQSAKQSSIKVVTALHKATEVSGGRRNCSPASSLMHGLKRQARWHADKSNEVSISYTVLLMVTKDLKLILPSSSETEGAVAARPRASQGVSTEKTWAIWVCEKDPKVPRGRTELAPLVKLVSARPGLLFKPDSDAVPEGAEGGGRGAGGMSRAHSAPASNQERCHVAPSRRHDTPSPRWWSCAR